jgi:hypothetical protein
VSRILLIAVRLAILRVAFLAEDVFAISVRPRGTQCRYQRWLVAGLERSDKKISRRSRAAATADHIVRAS